MKRYKKMKRQHSFVKELLALYEPYSETTKQLVAEELKYKRQVAFCFLKK